MPKPIHFNQYGSNILRERAFDDSPGPKAAAAPAKATSPILLSEDDSPPRAPNVFKINKLNLADRADIGWESPPGWEFDNETLAVHLAKLKKKHDGEVDNPLSSPTQASPANPQVVAPLPPSGSRRSAHGRGDDAEPALQKAMRAVAAENNPGMSPCKAFVAFSEFDDAHFLGVATDSAVVFDSSFGSPREIVSLIRLKEIAQACLAEAIVKAKAKQAGVLDARQQELASVAGSSGSSKEQLVESAVQGSQKSDSVAGEPQKGEKKKRKAGAQVLGPRTNLRNTPACQARMNNMSTK
jgi:hypothetical protein